MSLSDPRRVLVQATNTSGDTLTAGDVVHVVNSNSSVAASPGIRYAMKRDGATGSPQGRAVPTVGVVVDVLPVTTGATMNVCIQGACLALCEANGANIDSTDYLYVSDANIGGAVSYSLTNNSGRSRNFNGSGGNGPLDLGTGALDATVWTTAIRARTSDPVGGPTLNGLTLLADGTEGLVPVIILNNPGTNAE